MKGEDTKMNILFLENVGNPHNLGGITRTAAFFGIPYLFVSTFDAKTLFQQQDSEQNLPRYFVVK
jgi:tRNA G18 (ribose-2'-O)-methylase SpoU